MTLPLRNTTQQYGIIAQLLHWSIALLVIINFYLVYRREYIPKIDPANLNYILLHKALGVVVLFLSVIFVAYHFINIKPSYPRTMPAIEMRLSNWVHGLLFLLIILMPITGILMSIYGGRAVQVFNLFTISAMETPSKFWSGIFYQTHGYLSYAMIALVSIHVLAALRHHVFLHDNVLRGMLPVKLK